MKIVLNAENDLTVLALAEPDVEVEAAEGVHVHYSALEMFHASLALCTASVCAAYGDNIGVDTAGLEVRVRWRYVEDPFRVGDIRMEILWPGLPEERLEAAQRAAATCTIHNTLHHPPDVLTHVRPARG